MLETVVIHEGRLVAFHVEELHLLFIEAHALNRLLRAKALVELCPAAQIPELDLGKGATLAGLHQLALEDDPQLTLMLQDVAWFEIDGVNLHG